MKTKKFFGKKRRKVELTFDENERKQFLTGFQKRKAERKLNAKEVLEKELKEDKLRQRQRQKERLQKLYENQRTVPEVQHLLSEPTLTYELPQQMVSITTFDAKQISGSLGLTLGHNESNEEPNASPVLTDTDHRLSADDDSAGDDSDSADGNDLPQKIISVRKDAKKERLKAMKSSKALKSIEKMKHKKDLSNAKQKRKLLKREMKHMKQKSLLKRQRLNAKRNQKKRRKRPKPT